MSQGKAHEPTKSKREAVKLHATVGTPQEVIADILSIDPKTLRKHYREELDQSTAKANANMGGTLYNKGMGGDVTAMIFWMKTRAGWREKQEIDHRSSDGSMTPKDVSPAIILKARLDAITNRALGGDTEE